MATGPRRTSFAPLGQICYCVRPMAAPASAPVSPHVLGIAGGSGSGKSTISRAILEALPPGAGVLLEQDHYYRSQGHLPFSERERVNYDHPDALELDLLIAHLDALRAGRSISRPTYDFAQH